MKYLKLFNESKGTFTKDDIERKTEDMLDTLLEVFDKYNIGCFDDLDSEQAWWYIRSIWKDSQYQEDIEYVNDGITILHFRGSDELYKNIYNDIKELVPIIESRTGLGVKLISSGYKISIELKWETVGRKLKSFFTGYTSNTGPR